MTLRLLYKRKVTNRFGKKKSYLKIINTVYTCSNIFKIYVFIPPITKQRLLPVVFNRKILRRLDGLITHQICLKLFKILFLVIIYYLEKKKFKYLAPKFEHFSIYLKALRLEEVNITPRWQRPPRPLKRTY